MARVFKRTTTTSKSKAVAPQGKRDPRFPGCVLIPVSQQRAGLPKVGSDIADNTFYRFNEKEKKVQAFVTVDAAGHRLAWDTCGACQQHWTLCQCSAGVLHPDSVEWCIRKQAGWLAGEPINFDTGMDQYKKARRSGGGFKVSQSITPSKTTTKRSKKFVPDSAPAAPKRKFVRTKSGSAKVSQGVTLADINKAATDVAAEVEAMLDTSPRRQTRVYKRKAK